MIERDKLALYLDEFLSCNHFNDYAPNGLQIEGKPCINRIATAVTASQDVILEAIDWQADALLVHHGYFWRGEEAGLRGMKRQRIAKLLAYDINLFAYHLPLDCHPDLGNNACIAQCLNLNAVSMHRVSNTDKLLWSGYFAAPMTALDLRSMLDQIFGRPSLHINGHQRLIQSIAWCSGGAQDFIIDAKDLNVDAYLSGEVSERTYYQAKELGIDYYACGHHATERMGIQALGEHLAERFSLITRFFDSDNPF